MAPGAAQNGKIDPQVRVVMASDGLPIVVEDHGGTGPMLLLLHGWSCNRDFWSPAIDPLLAKYRVVTLDLPGHGASGAVAEDRDWSMVGFGEDVVTVADALDAAELAILGHSMGGAVAVEAAIRLGARCRFLLGVDTFNEAAFYGRRSDAEIRERAAIFEGDFGGTMRGMVGTITHPSADAAVVEWIGEAMAATEPSVGVAVLKALLAWDIEARWAKVAVPAATINSARLAARNELIDLPDLAVHHLDGVGHFPMLERPEAFQAMALDLLEGRF